jgi:hypothetical protein
LTIKKRHFSIARSRLCRAAWAILLVAMLAVLSRPVAAQEAHDSHSNEKVSVALIARLEDSDQGALPTDQKHSESPSADQSDETIEQLDFVYSPPPASQSASQNDEVANLTLQDLIDASHLMQAESYQARLRENLVVPVSSARPDIFAEFQKLSENEQKIFLSKKTRYLERIAKVLTVLRIPVKVGNTILQNLNDRLFERAVLVSRLNTQSVAMNVGFNIGISVPRWVLKQLRKMPMLSRLPEKAGFYMAFSVGVALVQTTVDGVQKVRIEPFTEFTRAEKIFGPLLTVGTGVSLSASFSAPNGAEVIRKKMIRFRGTAFESGETTVAQSHRLIGISFPPMGNSYAAIEGEMIKVRANARGFALLRDQLVNHLFPSLAQARPLSCRALF